MLYLSFIRYVFDFTFIYFELLPFFNNQSLFKLILPAREEGYFNELISSIRLNYFIYLFVIFFLQFKTQSFDFLSYFYQPTGFHFFVWEDLLLFINLLFGLHIFLPLTVFPPVRNGPRCFSYPTIFWYFDFPHKIC